MLSRQPQGSALHEKLEVRYDYVSEAVRHQDQFLGDIGWPAWWSDVGLDPQSLSVQKSKSLGTEETANNTSSRAASKG